MRSFDVVIVGAAIVGSATAYYLRQHGFKGSIALIERDMTFTRACTPLSLGGLRQQFSTPENIALSTFGLKLIRNLKQVFGAEADVGFKEQGYLLLAPPEGVPVLEENHATQVACGANTAMFSPAELKQRFPYLESDGVAAGCFGLSGEGWFDPYAMMSLFRKAALAQDVTLISAEVTALTRSGDAVTQATLSTGESIGVGQIVNAAGWGAGALAAMAGIEFPVGPRKRYVYVLDCPKASEALHRGPLTVDISGVYMRPEGRNFLCGNSPDEADEPSVLDWEVDHNWFEERIWPPLATRMPVFEEIKVVGSWVGHYDYNAFDQNAIYGRHPVVGNLIFANGFSGHGIQQGPASGNAVAELICFGAYRTIDVSRFSFSRVLDKKPLFEKNII